jgi:hypothetical protein
MIIPVRCFTCGKVTCPSPLSSCSRGRRAAGLCCVSLSPRVWVASSSDCLLPLWACCAHAPRFDITVCLGTRRLF